MPDPAPHPDDALTAAGQRRDAACSAYVADPRPETFRPFFDACWDLAVLRREIETRNPDQGA